MLNFIEYNNEKELYFDFIEEIKKNLKNNNNDFIVIVPNNILKNQLKMKLVDSFEVIFDLKIFTFDDFLLYKNFNNLECSNHNLFSKLLLGYSIKECFKKGLIEDNYFYKSPGFLEIALRFINYLKSSLITPEIFKEKIDSNSSLFPISSLYKEYSDNVKVFGLKDRYDNYYRFFDNKKYEDYLNIIKKIYIVGFIDFKLVEYEIIKILKNYVKLDILYFKSIEKNGVIYTETIKWFNNLDFNHIRRNSKSESLNKYRLIRAEDKFLEVKRLAIEIKRNMIEYPNKKHGIIYNNKDYINYISSRFKKEELPLDIDLNLSLIETNFGKNMYKIFNKDMNLLNYIIVNLNNNIIFEELIEDYNLEKILRNLNPDSFKQVFDSNLLKKHDKYMEYYVFLKEIEKMYSLRGKENIKEFIQSKLLKYMEIDSDNFEIYDNLYNFIEELFTVFCTIIDDFEQDEFFNYIKEILINFSIFKSNITGNIIKLIEFDDYKLLDYDFIYILGCDDKSYPKIERSNFYFNKSTFKILKELGVDLLNSKMLYSRDELNFSNILNMNNIKKYTSYEYSEEGLLTDFITNNQNDCEVEDYILKDYIKPSTKNVINNYDKRLFVSTFQEFKNITNNCTELNKKMNYKVVNNYDFTVSQLETYQQCPIKYYYTYFLKLEDKFLNKKARKNLDIGIACHESLRNIYENRLYEKEGKLSKKIIGSILSREFENLDYSTKKKEVINTIDRYSFLLEKLIINDIDFLGKSFEMLEPHRFEENIVIRKLLNINNNLKEININGRIDRIDKDSSGMLYLVDYKLGKSSAKKLSDFKRNDTLQFPIYSLMENIRGCRYLTINNFGISNFFTINCNNNNDDSDLSIKEFNIMQKDTINKIENIITRIENKDFFVGTSNLNNCRFCQYFDICGYRS